MDMPVRLLEAHPLAEEIRNQVVVKRGPIVYCLESMDIDGGKRIDDVQIPANIKFTPRKMQIAGSDVMVLEAHRFFERGGVVGSGCFIVK